MIQFVIDIVALVMNAANNKTENVSKTVLNIDVLDTCHDSTDSAERSDTSPAFRKESNLKSANEIIMTKKRQEKKDLNDNDFCDNEIFCDEQFSVFPFKSSNIFQQNVSKSDSDDNSKLEFWQLRSIDPSENKRNVHSYHKEGESEISRISCVGVTSNEVSKGIKRVSSAALRESMEVDRAKLNSIQRNIRTLAEKGEIDEIDELILERTIVAVRSVTTATELYGHIHSVRVMQKLRHKTLSSALSKLEIITVDNLDSKNFANYNLNVDFYNDNVIVNNIDSNRLNLNSPPRISSQTNSQIEMGNGLILPSLSISISSSSSSSSSSPQGIDRKIISNSEQCTWSEWLSIVEICSKEISIIDPRSTESAIQNLRDALEEQSRITNKLSNWFGMNEINSLNIISDDVDVVNQYNNNNNNNDDDNNYCLTMVIAMMSMMIGTIGIRKKNNNDDTDNNDMHR